MLTKAAVHAVCDWFYVCVGGGLLPPLYITHERSHAEAFAAGYNGPPVVTPDMGAWESP